MTFDRATLISENDWDKGLVFFGALHADAAVKVASSLKLLCKQDNFPYDDFVHVDLTFDEKPLKTDRKGRKSMGVNGPEWMAMSDGKGYMPGVMMDGKFFMESGYVVKMFAEKYPDESLTSEQQKEVVKWIDLNNSFTDGRGFEAQKHWGICLVFPANPHYTYLGAGQKDSEWEKETIKQLDAFFKIQDKHFETKENKAYFVGDKLTLADCAMINWAWSLSWYTCLNVSKRYPNVWAHNEALRASKPEGAEAYLGFAPIVGIVIKILGVFQRGIFTYGHHIENPKHWE